MKLVQFREDDADGDFRYYREDLRRIQRAMAAAGYICSVTDAKRLWRAYSSGMAAGWMTLPDSDEAIVDCVREYLDDD